MCNSLGELNSNFLFDFILKFQSNFSRNWILDLWVNQWIEFVNS
jgi:hypothetical protein